MIIPAPLSEPTSDAALSPLPSNSACRPIRPGDDRLALARQHRARIGIRERELAARLEPIAAAPQHELSAGAPARERALDVVDRNLAIAEPQRAAHLARGERRRQRGPRGGEIDAAGHVAERVVAERFAAPCECIAARPRHSGRDREQRHHVGRVGIDLALDAFEIRELEPAAHRSAADRAGDAVERDIVRGRIQLCAQRDRQQRGRARRSAAPQRADIGRLQGQIECRREAAGAEQPRRAFGARRKSAGGQPHIELRIGAASSAHRDAERSRAPVDRNRAVEPGQRHQSGAVRRRKMRVELIVRQKQRTDVAGRLGVHLGAQRAGGAVEREP